MKEDTGKGTVERKIKKRKQGDEGEGWEGDKQSS